MNYYKYIFSGYLLLFSWFVIGQNQEEKQPWMELHGYVKNLQSTNFMQKIDSNASATIIHNRFNFKFNISSKFSGRLELRNRIFYGEQIKRTPQFGENINQDKGLFSLSHLWINDESFVAQSVIDRILIQYSDEKWDIKLGRQRINWGINNVWNPNDIFNAYNIFDFDYEERPGVDALRIQRNLNDNSSIEFAYKASKNSYKNNAAALYKINKWKYDFQFLAGVFERDFVLGGGFAGNIKEAGFKGELTYFRPKTNVLDSPETFSFSIMADQTFKNDWYISIATLYNSHPTNFLGSETSPYNSNLSAKLLFPFRYNFHSTIMKTISPIRSFSFSFIYSPQKNTLILFPTYIWNVAPNLDFDISAQSFFQEEFQSYQNLETALFLRSRWSF